MLYPILISSNPDFSYNPTIVLGHGAFGAVYLGRMLDEEHAAVAVKVISLNTDTLPLYQTEAKINALLLDSPYIIAMRSHVQILTTAHLVFELCDTELFKLVVPRSYDDDGGHCIQPHA